MADRLVTHVARRGGGRIAGIANPDEDWRQRRSEWAISDIRADRHAYFVEGTRGQLRPIDVVNGGSGPYLRTRADPTEDNNLASLPLVELAPWEVALADAEVLVVHAALVPRDGLGQVLFMGGSEHDPSHAAGGDIHNTRIYDVASNVVIAIESPAADVFCCDHAFLEDGRLLVGGGTGAGGAFPVEPDPDDPDPDDPHHFGRRHWSGARECAIYDNDGTWTPAASLLPEPGHDTRGGGRWYPTLITLGDGRILAVGGHPRSEVDDPALSDARHGSWLPETYDPGAEAWTYQPGHWLYVDWDDIGGAAPPDGQEVPGPGSAGNYIYYPRLFTVPDGRVFLASPNNGRCGWYDPATGMVDEPALAPPPHGDAFAETNHTAVLLPLLPGDSYTPTVLFFGLEGPHRITLGPDGETPAWAPTTHRDWVSQQAPAVLLGCPPRPPRDWVARPPLRRHGCATLLPTGDVCFTGGIDSTAGAGLPDCDGILEAEIYHPGFNWGAGVIDVSREGWTTTPPGSVARNYHSVALLLPNGRVLTAGGNIDGQSGPDSVKQFRVEVFCPAYDGATNRPVLVQAPAALSYGESFQIVTTRADRIERVALMRCGSVTHAWDGDQRYVGLTFANPAPGVIEAVAPPNGNVAPPGPYMIWVVDDLDRPCRQAMFTLLS